MKIKKLIFVVSVFMALSLTACQGNSADNLSVTQTPAGETPASTDVAGGKETVTMQYAVGDIVFADDTVMKADHLTEINGENLPVAVIAGFKENGAAFGIGVHRSDAPLQWASDDTVGYSTRFEDTVCTQDAEKEDVFHGDTDGSDNWEAVCKTDSQGTSDAKENYPAFYFVNTYAEKYALADSYASGWYMPDIAGLCTVYKNRKAVNASLKKIYELDSSAAMSGLDTNWYWSSSQAGSEDDHAWFVHYFNGYAGECPKNFDNLHVIAVRDF